MKLILVFISVMLVSSLHFTPTSLCSNKKTQSVRTQIYTAEQELAGFKVPEGFIIEMVASEKEGVINPIDLTFAGRLWTQTAMMYPLDPIADIQWNDLLK